MTTCFLEEKVKTVFSLIKEEKDGITLDKLEEQLIKKQILFTSFMTFEDIIDSNLLIGRICKSKDRIYLTEKGEAYINESFVK